YGGNSFVKVLHGDIPPQIYHDAIVLIGPYATGMMDQYYTPIDAGKLMYGAEIHANVIDALIDQNFKSPVSFPLQCLLLGICAALCFLLFCRCDPRLSAVLLVLFSAAYLFLVSFVYRQGYILHVLYLPLTIAVLYFYRMIHSYFSERRRRQTVTDTFKRYMEPRVVEQLLKDGAAQASMEGQKRDIAVLFVDIRGFTAMSEALDTTDVVGILNEYLSLASEAIFNNQGTLDKFIGDAAMAIFNAPLDLDDYTYRAVKTALELSAGSEALGARLMERFGRTVSFGIGVNCGEAIVGNIGAHFRLDYTAIGDTVNTAARLEGRAASGQILISDAVYERLRDRIAVTELGPMSFKGKSHEILTYQVDGLI
ncbi:MAG: adenylate/guanylate cyclase domain-containing protein, partial [Angelakisella sp.]